VNKNILAGNLNVGGYVDFSSTSGFRDDATTFETSVQAKYFLLNRLALGLAGSTTKVSGQEAIAYLGPIAAYHFFTTEHASTWAQMGFRFGLTDRAWDNRLTASVGMDYFITPSVAFGPSVYFNRFNSGSRSARSVGLELNFGIYL
jgi:hypothetical protein